MRFSSESTQDYFENPDATVGLQWTSSKMDLGRRGGIHDSLPTLHGKNAACPACLVHKNDLYSLNQNNCY